MSYIVDQVRDFRTKRGTPDCDSTISHFKCDDTQCSHIASGELGDSYLPEGWFAMKDGKGGLYHACSAECRIRVLAWWSAEGTSGRSSD